MDLFSGIGFFNDHFLLFRTLIVSFQHSTLSSNIMHEFAVFPDLSVRLRNFDKSLSRFFELASSYVQEKRDLLLSSQLLTYVLFKGIIFIKIFRFHSDLSWIHWSDYSKLNSLPNSFHFILFS